MNLLTTLSYALMYSGLHYGRNTKIKGSDRAVDTSILRAMHRLESYGRILNYTHMVMGETLDFTRDAHMPEAAYRPSMLSFYGFAPVGCDNPNHTHDTQGSVIANRGNHGYSPSNPGDITYGLIPEGLAKGTPEGYLGVSRDYSPGIQRCSTWNAAITRFNSEYSVSSKNQRQQFIPNVGAKSILGILGSRGFNVEGMGPLEERRNSPFTLRFPNEALNSDNECMPSVRVLRQYFTPWDHSRAGLFNMSSGISFNNVITIDAGSVGTNLYLMIKFVANAIEFSNRVARTLHLRHNINPYVRPHLFKHDLFSSVHRKEILKQYRNESSAGRVFSTYYDPLLDEYLESEGLPRRRDEGFREAICTRFLEEVEEEGRIILSTIAELSHMAVLDMSIPGEDQVTDPTGKMMIRNMRVGLIPSILKSFALTSEVIMSLSLIGDTSSNGEFSASWAKAFGNTLKRAVRSDKDVIAPTIHTVGHLSDSEDIAQERARAINDIASLDFVTGFLSVPTIHDFLNWVCCAYSVHSTGVSAHINQCCMMYLYAIALNPSELNKWIDTFKVQE